MTYRIFLFLKILVTFVILLFTCNIKILVLIVSFLNGFRCIVLRMITFVLTDISTILIMSSFLFLTNSTNLDFTLILVGSSITFCCLKTSFSSVPLSSKSFLDSFSKENELLEVLESSSLELVSSFPVILSR